MPFPYTPEAKRYDAATVYADDKLGFRNQPKLMDLAKRACKSAGATKSFCKNFR